MKYQVIRWLLGLSLCFTLLVPGWSKIIEVEGSAALTGDTVTPGVRQTALLDAMRLAIEQGVGLYINSETMTNNYELVHDKILTRAKGYVRKYDTLSERTQDGVFYLKIQADVNERKIKDDLAALQILQSAKRNPRVMVIITGDKNSGNSGTIAAAENEMIKRLIKKEFQVIDSAIVDQYRNTSQAQDAYAGNNQAAQYLGKKAGAEIVIIGEAAAEGSADNNLAGMVSAKANVSARAIRSDTGSVIISDDKDAAVVDLTVTTAGKKAIIKASGQLADSLILQISEKWGQEVANGNIIHLVVKGVSFEQLQNLEEYLKDKINGVKNLDRRNYDGKAGKAEIDLLYQYDAQTLAEQLGTQTYIKLLHQSANQIELEIQP